MDQLTPCSIITSAFSVSKMVRGILVLVFVKRGVRLNTVFLKSTERQLLQLFEIETVQFRELFQEAILISHEYLPLYTAAFLYVKCSGANSVNHLYPVPHASATRSPGLVSGENGCISHLISFPFSNVSREY